MIINVIKVKGDNGKAYIVIVNDEPKFIHEWLIGLLEDSEGVSNVEIVSNKRGTLAYARRMKAAGKAIVCCALEEGDVYSN